MILDDDFRPITNSVGVLARTAPECAAELRAWREKLAPGERVLHQLDPGSVRDRLGLLSPLVERGVTRELLTPIHGDWTAYFGNWWKGTDLSSVIPVLSRRLGCVALRVTCTPDIGRRPTKRYGSRIVEVYRGASSSARAIWSSNDGGRWVAGATGDALPEEDPAWLAPASPRERFPESALRELVSRLVPGFFAADGWSRGTAFLLERLVEAAGTASEHELADVQRDIPTLPRGVSK
jgi:hypothetical protein